MKKFCPECKTENEEQFNFCKNCGTALDFKKEKLSGDFKTPEQFDPTAQKGSPMGNGMPEEIEGVQKREMLAFLGKDADKIYDKFLKMEYSGSKVSWCWPAFLLTAFLGFFGSAIWFFYRKMFKPAIAFIIAGTLVLGVQTALNFDNNIEVAKDIVSSIESIFGGNMDSVANPELFFDEEGEPAIGEPTGVLALISDILDTAETLVGGAVIAMFALHIYKKHAVEKIKEQREKHGETPYYLYTLSLSGGTSGGMLALGIIIFVVLSNLASAIPTFFAISGI
ncbi:MAG: zinc ribbon domain-containing protein [Ruminococcaceae bacterium]|nr:zinc ribbon domain-containing protein [Oscillospiraceae bacterium]